MHIQTAAFAPLSWVFYANSELFRIFAFFGFCVASNTNARIFRDIVKEQGSFYDYLCRFTDGEILYECDKTTNEWSDRISADLKKRGMKFVGSVIIYSFLQAVGVIYSHDRECGLYREK